MPQLTDQMVKLIQPTNTKREISDHSESGLMLVIQPKRGDGSKPSAKTFVWRGRIRGHIRKITIGRAEVMKVTKARTRAFEITNQVREGRDPYAELQAAKSPPQPVASTPTVSEAFRAYMDNEGSERKSASEKERIFKREIEPLIGIKPMTEVTPAMLAEIVNEKAKTAPVQANHVQALLSRFFRWSASSKGWAASGIITNTMMGVVKPTKTRPRERTLSQREIQWVLQACRELQGARFYEGQRSQATSHWAMVVELLLRTGQRRSDILNLSHDEIEGNIATLDGYRHKSGTTHKFHLTDQCLGLIAKAGKHRQSPRVFNCSGNEETYIQRVRKRAALIAKGEGGKLAHWTLHDLRRTVSTILADAEDAEGRAVTSTEEIKKLLGHTLQGAIAAYLKGHALPMKKRIMLYWNDWVDELSSGQRGCANSRWK